MKLENYNKKWAEMFDVETRLIETVLEPEEIVDIQLIGSTAIKSIKSKPIVDIAVLVSPDEYIQSYVRPLAKIGYVFDPESSSTERLFFRKGDPVRFHLSITQEGYTPFWDRQIIFRDYLNNNPDMAIEYEALKITSTQQDSLMGQKYTDAKSEFVNKVLRLANEGIEDDA